MNDPVSASDPEPGSPELDQRIHLVCVRPAGDFERFDARLATLAARYAETMRVTVIHPGPGGSTARPQLWSKFGTVLPTVVLLRRGQIIAEAIGDLPLRELEAVVRCAVTWPAAAAA